MTHRRRTSRVARRHRLLFAVLGCAIALSPLVGCTSTADQHERRPGLPPFLLRMQSYYPDLESGRFMCLAHFETPQQALLFRVLEPDGALARQQPSISVLRARDETGSGGLLARLENPEQIVSFDGARSEQSALIRDWRAYPTLLLSIYGPPEGASVEMAVRSGVSTPLAWTRSLHVNPGWNLYRFDVPEIGEMIDLADVRAVQWRLTEGGPVDLFFDDIILADNTQYVAGEEAGAGEFYVFHRGRRTYVGVRDRFELAFADGLIVAWCDRTSPVKSSVAAQPTAIELAPQEAPAAAPASRTNLTAPAGLGPHPLALPANWSAPDAPPLMYDSPALFSTWGQAVAARQWTPEISSTRVIVQGQWIYLTDPSQGPPTTDAGAASHTWQYVIYPNGEVFVTVATVTGGRPWPTPYVGYAVALSARQGFDVLHSATAVLFARGRGQADLAWCPHDPATAATITENVSVDDRRLTVNAGVVAPADVLETAHLLRFWPNDIDGLPDVESIAQDYQTPPKVTPAVGQLLRDVPGDIDHDGYNEAHGVIEVRPEGGVLRLTLDPGGVARYAPRLRLHDVKPDACWVYVNGGRVHDVGVDAQGRAIVLLPRVVGKTLKIEAHCRKTPEVER